jgi:hypothetical protein
MTAVEIPQASVEKLECEIVTDVDPLPFNVDFAFTIDDAGPSTWTAGTWIVGSAHQVSTGWRATALTPMLGTGLLDLVPDDWSVWVRVGLPGGETPVMQAGTLRVV